MEISNAHHLQVMATLPLEEVLSGCPNSQQQEKRVRPQPEQALKCPRCESTNTKFCYYNNYSLSQPRYFCKGCRRYWTKGGSLRNVPVGGGCRKNKRSSSSSSSSSKRAQDQALNSNSNASLPTLMPPHLSCDPSDLSLAFARLQRTSTTPGQLGLEDHDHLLLGNPNPNPNPNPYHSHVPTVTGPGFLDILRSGFLDGTNPSGFHNPYFSFGGNGNAEEEGPVLMPFGGGFGGAATTTTSTITTARSGQGSCKAEDGEESKVLIGLQWQGGGDGNMGVDSGREYYWNGVGSSWHGLVNSSLM